MKADDTVTVEHRALFSRWAVPIAVAKFLKNRSATAMGTAQRDTLLGAEPGSKISPPDASTSQLEESTRGHMYDWLKRAKLERPTPFDGESKDASQNSKRWRSFLRAVQRFLIVTGLMKVAGAMPQLTSLRVKLWKYENLNLTT